MKRVPLQEVAPGMVLVKPVTNSAGHVVVAAGMTLNEPLITHLERLGKAAVYVEGAPDGGASKSFEELEGELAGRFRKVKGEPQLARIHEAIRQFLKSQTEDRHD
ncbi:MAG: hypothetical protein E6K67_08850 [Nitrospirae bacterium]|nr:MAG: hypothetical protein E6K67_08850 [Nitrospirota bacterium]